MHCPQCGNIQLEELQFCKTCGTNLSAVRKAMTTRNKDDKSEKLDLSKTWVAEMLLTNEEKKRRRRENQTSYSVEERRYNEIKAGVITGGVGVALMIFLYVFMQGLIASGIDQHAAAILSRVWIAGVLPFFVGLALAFNGVVVSKKLVDLAKREIEARDTAKMLAQNSEPRALSAADWSLSDSPQPSVTENTTRELRESR